MLPTALNSCLYKAKVMHHRLAPKVHSFNYHVFMFYLDLDEIDTLNKRLVLMSRNRFNLFNFRDKDHLQLPREKPDASKNVRQQINNYLFENGITTPPARIMVLTNLSTLGYQFNPVSFYFCYDARNRAICAVVEVCNTFHEMKPYFLGANHKRNAGFKLNTQKNFYVSPFIDLDTNFDFDLKIPGDILNISIDDYDKKGERFFMSRLIGNKKPLTDFSLLLYFLSFPLITLKVMGMIHWQALQLWLKKIPFHKKNDDIELQKGVFRPYRAN